MGRGPIEQAQLAAMRELRAKFYPAPPVFLGFIVRERAVQGAETQSGILDIAVAEEPLPYEPDAMVVPPAEEPAEAAPAEEPLRYPVTSQMTPGRTRQQHARVIIQNTAQVYGVPLSEVLGPIRKRAQVAARHEAIWRVSVAFPDMSLPQIGRIFSGRDHTTILHAIGLYDDKLRLNGRAAYIAERIKWGASAPDPDVGLREAELAWDQGAAEARKQAGKRVRDEREKAGRAIQAARQEAEKAVGKKNPGDK